MLNLSKQSISKQVNEQFELHSLNTLHTPRSAVILKRWLMAIVVILLLILFLPWQQNVTGKGDISAFTPKDRPQNVQNIISGRIEEWLVKEGDLVEKGDTLLVISETKDDYFDPNLPSRLQEQLTAKKAGLASYQAKIDALSQQIVALEQNQKFSLQKARNKVKQGFLKVTSDSTDVIAEQVQFNIAQTRYDRGEDQYKNGGLVSLSELESRKLKLQETRTKLVSTQNKLAISRQELTNAQIELNSIGAEYAEKIAKAESDRSSAYSSLAAGQYEISQLSNKITNVDIRRNQYYIKAPQEGYVVRALKAGIGENIKEGESICTLQPFNPAMAVELYVKAMDVPLITEGREVRLQFEGWPSLVFSGWPSATVGTFGGIVKVIDRIDNTKGEYRLLIVPKIAKGEQKWPKQLRMGSGVAGWVMLDDVPVWYEIWRQLNAFPPTLKQEPEGALNHKKAK
ncbi:MULTISPECIES: HlyD family efflux transporter periplasmic adaptor subunit [unclassified Arcicella]|uniref:HlyD family secretion protein n=1 Tax=unclassified Arcicella TaxID=2644986 RepID=UPI00285F65CF|nr:MULTISPECIES: HlyD family efflux transporter periplasmic adaptor subunit [unclassified Arcicella]MDR6562761.1 multidrug efflux pump subunit AcrA (membrane-fusion protein) [Arcicella sp. BE51]MDR6812894.1 multidrug efflux pump subunit AcrA (membrane-fusion protein) [Arcicella sp. BE140]MDR6824208.1 multidrug efflux pump subunit AcrA (membrane-fusion protein) [Arcicella sp. BE139]